jgi:Carboxypeptidase regulatory-like domain/TonB dependent receptor
MNRILRTALALAFFACACLLTHVPASAQSVYGSIFGTVTDSSGAAVPTATITVRDESKGTAVTATANGSGDYNVPHLIPDVYDLKVTAKGFKVFEAKGISVQADTAPRIDPTLEVGAENTTVEVNADQQPELKTDRADVSTVFDQQQVSSLPVGDQNFTNLQLLLPGAQLLGWSHAADENPQGSKQIQVDGQAFGGTAFELDGTDNQDPILGIIVINPALDAVTETKITTQNFDAELGKAVSAVVTAQTRSGTNNFHGSAYDFRTGNANYARDPFNVTPGAVSLANPSGLPPGLKNRFGGSIGGPALKDRLFFFFNYEAQRQKVGTSATDTLPTSTLTESALGNIVGPGFDGANTVAGADLGEYEKQLGAAGIIYDNTKPYTGTDGKTHYRAFPDNVIPKAQISPQTLALLKLLEPSTKGIGLGTGINGSVNGLDENFKESGTGLFNSNQWTERVDFTINEKMHAFERFSRFWDTLSGAVMFGAAGGPGFGINNYGGNSNGANDSLASGMDIALSPKLLTDFRLGYYRYNVIDTKHDQGTNFATTLGIPGINIGGPITSGAPGFVLDNLPGGGGGTNGTVFGDGLNINRCNCPLTEREDQFQIVNNWTRVVGNHSIKVGADLRYGRNLRVPSDNDRAGQLNFKAASTEDPAAATPAGLGFGSFILGDVTTFNRYVSTSTNAKEFQKRTFFYGQDTWRVNHKLTLNLGLRWEIYFPESVNGAGNGALLNLTDGYLHVAGVGGIGSNLGWNIDKKKQFAPRIGLTYQLNEKTVIRSGYGRSFDTGVFGSIFGHTVTQNIPVLANQQINNQTANGEAFTLAVGPTPYSPVPVPSNGLLPNPGSTVGSSARNDPLNFPTIDAWNLAVQRALTPTMSLTLAYVGNKGTHTLGDGDSNGTNPNESFVTLPGANSVTGQTLHYDPSVPAGTIAANGGTSTNNLLQRYFAAKLPACSDPNYVSPGSPYAAVPLPAGDCGWTNSIAFRGDTQNTEFDALQVTLSQAMKNGLSANANYQWASAFGDTTNLWTWSHSLPHLRDSQVRAQQLTLYGSYDLPFGKGKQFAQNANRATDLLIGGYQLAWVTNWSGGLPFTVSYNESGANVNDCPNPATSGGCVPNAHGRMKTNLTSYVANGKGTGSRTFYQQQTKNVTTDAGTGIFTNPGLDTYGNAGLNTYRGPNFFSTDLAITKAFTIWEHVATKFRMDAFNAFNHITAGNPGGNIESVGSIGGEGGGCGQGQDCGPRQLEFSLRVQF